MGRARKLLRQEGHCIVALTARDMSDMGRLAQLAANPEGVTREEIFLAVASLYRVQGPRLTPRERGLTLDILQHLARDVEMAIRIALAERLADDLNAPHDLILLLADDRIEVARPIILRSALLSDKDVLGLIAEASIAHQEVLAQRPHIGEQVTDVLARSEQETVLEALLRNTTARIGDQSYVTLVEKSRHFMRLQAPLIERQDLPQSLAVEMCGWVSEALKAHILRNFDINESRIVHVLEDAEHSLLQVPSKPKLSPTEGAQKLIEKLSIAGQLKPGFLLRVLHQGQADLFDLAFARLLNMDLKKARRVLYENGPDWVALACRAVGIDRAVFPTVYSLSRQARGMQGTLTLEQQKSAQGIFSRFDRIEALATLLARLR